MESSFKVLREALSITVAQTGDASNVHVGPGVDIQPIRLSGVSEQTPELESSFRTHHGGLPQAQVNPQSKRILENRAFQALSLFKVLFKEYKMGGGGRREIPIPS